VFTDIVGFTALTAIHGDDAAVELLARQDRIVSELLPPNSRVVKELGDGLLLWFDDARAAVVTTVALLDRYDRDDGDLPLWVRVGIHWGRPKRRGTDIVGHDVNLASRITDIAGTGEVLCSLVAAEQAQADGPIAGIGFERLGAVVAKGIPDPIPLARVARAPRLG
jgi:adenylate cyclase